MLTEKEQAALRLIRLNVAPGTYIVMDDPRWNETDADGVKYINWIRWFRNEGLL